VVVVKLFGRFLGGVALLVGAAGAGAGIALIPIASSPAGAATTLVVNDANDGAATPGNCTTSTPTTGPDCTLRAGLMEAATLSGSVVVSLPDPNGVEFNHGLVYQVLASSLPMATLNGSSAVSLVGVGAGTSKIQAQCASCTPTFGVFIVHGAGATSISGVTIEDGHETTNSGGGIWNDAGTLTVSNSTITNNFSINVGGGIYNQGVLTLQNNTITSNVSAGRGGGVDQEFDTSGFMTLSGDTITNNSDSGDGGGLYIDGGTATLTNETISDNSANPGSGGGMFINAGTVTLSDNTISGNNSNAGAGGGGLIVEGGTSTFSGDTISSNTATAGSNGGGMEIDGGTNRFTGETIGGAAGSDGNSVSNAGSVSSEGGGADILGGTNTFSGGNVSNNVATDSNGGAFFIGGGTNTFNGVPVNANAATWSGSVGAPNGDGGGFFIDFGTNTFTGGSISGGLAYEGAGVYTTSGEGGPADVFTNETISGNDATEAGGGFAFDTFQQGSTSITASTISGNVVRGLVGISALLGDGGGILSVSCNAIALTNDTITGNTAVNGGGYFGEACPELPTVSTAFKFDTVAGNTATDGGTGAGNVQTIDDSTLTFAQTIIANGSASGGPNTNCEFTGPGVVTSLGYNLIDNTNCGTAAATDIIGKDPQLGPLANNGGPTQTLLPADSAPEVGAIPDATCVGTGVGMDQRGLARGAGANSSCTIGAVEVGQNFNGYRLVANEGGIFDFGLLFSGSLANNHLNAPIVDLANAPGPAGYLMVGSDGGVFALGGAAFFGSLGGQTIPSPIAAIAAPPSENGYWLAAQNGKIYNYGAAPALPAIQLPQGAHIVGMASTTDGQGAWLTDQLGDVYAEGSAHYVGGLGGVHINMPIVGIAAAASGQGYVLVATDGGAFAYGTQHFFGSVPGSLKPGQSLNAPVVGIAVTHSGNGYWEVGSDGGVFTYGDAPFLGSMAGTRLNGPVVGIQHLGSATATG
jgi:hypothetical protein